MPQVLVIILAVAVVLALGACAVLGWSLVKSRRGFESQAQSRAHDALAVERGELEEFRRSIERRDHRLTDREDRLDAQAAALEEQLESHRAASNDLRDRERALVDAEDLLREELERRAGLSADQARDELVDMVELEAHRRGAVVARDIEQAAIADGEAKARSIMVDVMHRVAAEQTTESVVSTVDLPTDEMKGRIIGREGRNIRAFEQITGVNVMVDDTPGTVLLSCFDPVRREVARLALIDLVADGRIHPARIEEVHARATERITARCGRAATDAAAKVGIHDLHPEIMRLLGVLNYRTSYGQNVLKHLIECAHIASLLASELGIDPYLARRSAFLHDIGKALTHQMEGSHAIVGADIARRHGEVPEVVHAIEAHHDEVEPASVEAILTQVADQISGGRPGARRETLESYVHRLERLESIAAAHDGVDKVFAMQAGRDVRVLVDPAAIDDIEAQVIARAIVQEVEAELTYPGQIRVTVVRESRAVEVAR